MIATIPWLGIIVAIFGAVFLSLGTQLQHRGVGKVELSHGTGEKAGLTGKQFFRLLARPSWLTGTAMLGLVILFQLLALSLAPLIVVQPVGIVALVLTGILNARISRLRLDRYIVESIVMCVVGIAIFVMVAAFYASEQGIREDQLITILVVLGSTILTLGAIFTIFRQRLVAMFYVVAGAVLYGFVASITKVMLNRMMRGSFDGITLLGVACLFLALALGFYFVQTAYSMGSPDLVIAGLTVIDPLVAVLVSIFVLGETQFAPLWAVFVWTLTGVLAIVGVFRLAKYHPQTHRRES